MDPKIIKHLKARKFLMVLSHMIRVLLSAITFFSLATLIIWVYHPGLVDGFEQWIRDGYGKKFKINSLEIETLMKKKQFNEAYSILSDQLREMGEVRKLDKLRMPYTETLDKLHYLAKLTGNNELKLKITQLLVDLDSNDVDNLIEHSRALAETGKYEEASSYLLRANRISPTLRVPVEQLMVYYARTNRKKEARDLLDSYQNSNRHLLVQLKLLRPQRTEGSTELGIGGFPVSWTPQTLRLQVAEGTDGSLPEKSRLRLSFSGEPLLYMKIGKITAKTTQGNIRFEPEDLGIELSTDTGEILLEGMTPSVTLDVPRVLFNRKLKEFLIEAEFRPALSPVMLRVQREIQ